MSCGRNVGSFVGGWWWQCFSLFSWHASCDGKCSRKSDNANSPHPHLPSLGTFSIPRRRATAPGSSAPPAAGRHGAEARRRRTAGCAACTPRPASACAACCSRFAGGFPGVARCCKVTASSVPFSVEMGVARCVVPKLSAVEMGSGGDGFPCHHATSRDTLGSTLGG